MQIYELGLTAKTVNTIRTQIGFVVFTNYNYLCAKFSLPHSMMQIEVLKSKIHRATVTDANLNYIGSVTLDSDLMDAANLMEFEKVQVLNINNGERIETYVIKGRSGSGEVVLNGAAARKVQPGDIVIIVSFAMMPVEVAKLHKPVIIFPDSNNKLP